MPLSVLEAMAEGLPVIASDVIGNRDAVLESQSGFLFPLDKPQRAAEDIVRLKEQPLLREKMGLLAHKHVRTNFTVSKMAAETVELYRQVMSPAKINRSDNSSARCRFQ